MPDILHQPNAVDIVLSPGQIYFGQQPGIVHTLLGSCVAATIWHPQKKVGGMCHYLLSDRNKFIKTSHQPIGYFGSDAVDFFHKKVQIFGLSPASFEVKLFGGGNMFSDNSDSQHPLNVSESNIACGREMFLRYGFRIKTEDVGGVRYRKIYFDLTSGDVWVKYGRNSR